MKSNLRPPLSIYIHIPFCTRKCDYCHFYVIPLQERFITQYLEALKLDIRRYQEQFSSHEIVSIYFGGGTPSLLEPPIIEKILSLFTPFLQGTPEITFEANPESITKEKTQALKALGINRISLGIQSFNDEELTLLSRQHGKSTAEKAIWGCIEGGIENLSIDLMYDLPHQTEARFHASLQKATKLPITHLSLYNLTVEPHTTFYKKRKQLEKAMPSTDVSLTLLEKAVMLLESHGLKRYEISAFAREGKESLHNKGYWTYRPYLGFGPSAHSFFQGSRFRKTAHFQRWVKELNEGKAAIDFEETLEPAAALREKVVIGLRLFEGTPYPDTLKPELLSLEKEGFLTLFHDKACLTKKGHLFYDSIAERLI